MPGGGRRRPHNRASSFYKSGSLSFGVDWGLGRDGLFFEGTLRLKMSELAQVNTDAAMSKWGPHLGPI